MRDRYYIAKLALTEFRNHPFRAIRLGDAPAVIVGENGAGKTNILEAASLLAPGRGLRGASLAEVKRAGAAGEWGVAATVVTEEGGETRLGTGEKPGSKGRRLHIDGKEAAKQADLLDHVRILWYAPAMQHRLSAGASDRRQWLDRLAAAYHPSHERKLRGYEHYMRERMRLLSQAGAPPDAGWLDALEKEMALRAAIVAEGRVRAADRLARAMAGENPAFPQAELYADGDAEQAIVSGEGIDALSENLRQRLKESRSEDARLGRTHIGAHRGDFIVRYKQKNLALEYCSTGEQKALLLSVLLAHMRALAADAGVAPILLLDEAFSQLDLGRRLALCDELLALRAQFWLTGADKDAFSMLKNKAEFMEI